MLPQKVGRQLKLVRITSAPGARWFRRNAVDTYLGAHLLESAGANPLAPILARRRLWLTEGGLTFLTKKPRSGRGLN